MVPPESLEGVHFLHGLTDDHRRQIASIAELREVPSGAVVFREGETSPRAYLVLEGRVSLEFCAPGRGCQRIQTIGPGELVGWSPILEAGPMTATARALAPCRLVTLHAPQLLALCAHSPPLGMELMRRTALALAQRLNATRLQLLDVYRSELPVFPDEGGPV